MTVEPLRRPTTMSDPFPASHTCDGIRPDRLTALRAEARQIADKDVDELITGLARLSGLSARIAEGGDEYRVGVRQIAGRLEGELARHGVNLRALQERI